MVFDIVQFKNNKTLAEQVKIFLGVQQVIKFTTLVIRAQNIEKIGNIKILFFYLIILQHFHKIFLKELIKGIEAGKDIRMFIQLLIIELQCIAQCYIFAAI